MTAENEIPPRPVRWPLWLAGLLTLWFASWFGGKVLLAHQLAAFRSDLADSGTTITCGSESWTGFPFRYTLTCLKPRLTSRNASTVTARKLMLSMWFPNPFLVNAKLTGPTQIDTEIVTHEPASGQLSFTPFGSWSAKLSVPNLAWPKAFEANELTLAATRGGKFLTANVGGTAVTVKGIEQPLVLDSLSANAETDARLVEAEDPYSMMADKRIALTIKELHLVSGAAEIKSEGQLSLDPQHRLDGTLASEVNDIDALMALLAPALKLTEGEVAGAKTVIGLLGGDPNSKARKLDLIAKNGELYFGPFKFADVPPFE